MTISVKETTIFSVFHPDAQDLYNTCSDLKKIAWELWDPSFRLNAEVGYPFIASSQTCDNLARIKQSSYFTLSRQCCVSVQRRRSKKLSEK